VDRLIAVAKHKDYRDPPHVIQIGGTWTPPWRRSGLERHQNGYLDDVERADIIRRLELLL